MVLLLMYLLPATVLIVSTGVHQSHPLAPLAIVSWHLQLLLRHLHSPVDSPCLGLLLCHWSLDRQHLGFLSLHRLASAGASTSRSYLSWLIVASTSIPTDASPPIFQCHASHSLRPFCPLSIPADCHPCRLIGA
jgi:hypothetical protein